MILDIYDYISILDAGGSVNTHGAVKNVLSSVKLPTSFSLGTGGPIWDQRGILVDEEFAINIATRNFEMQTDEIDNGWFVA